MNGFTMQIVILAVFILGMYFLLIRPQKKKEKEITDMRNSVQVGDEIITIGGICGKVVKTKDDRIVIQVGADRNKIELMRWSVSKVETKSTKPVKEDKKETSEAKKTSKPKKLGASKKEEEAVKTEEKPVEAVEKAEEADKVVE